MAERSLRLRLRLLSRPSAAQCRFRDECPVFPRDQRRSSGLPLPRARNVAPCPVAGRLGDTGRLRSPGYRAMIERHVALAKRLADQIRASSDFELLAEPRLNVVCFRYRPAATPEGELDEINRRLGQAIIADGTVYFGTTVYAGKVAFRPAVANWRTTERDVDVIVPIARELATRIGAGRLSPT